MEFRFRKSRGKGRMRPSPAYQSKKFQDIELEKWNYLVECLKDLDRRVKILEVKMKAINVD
jgi:hypothetical protein